MFHRILVVRTDRIGDVVLATPLLRSLRKSFPDAQIAAMVRPYTRDVLAHNPNVDEIILDDPDEHKGVAGFLSQVRTIRKHRFDVALILLPKSRLSWMLFLAGIPLRVSVETRLDHLLTFTRTVTRDRYIPLRHEADYCLDLGRKIGAKDDGLDVDVFVTPEESEGARAKLRAAGVQETDRLIGIHPVSGKSSPNWNIERYKELVAMLLKRPGTRIVVTGSPGDASVLRMIETIDPARVHAVQGGNLRETISVLSHLDLLISASTGPMHLAAGLKVPTVSLFCPLPACSPALWGPRGNSAEVILPPRGYCQRQCPADPHVCEFEGGIFPKDVVEVVNKMEADQSGRPA
jgi:ADP-heptose:LPS heptosyltransferase